MNKIIRKTNNLKSKIEENGINKKVIRMKFNNKLFMTKQNKN